VFPKNKITLRKREMSCKGKKHVKESKTLLCPSGPNNSRGKKRKAEPAGCSGRRLGNRYCAIVTPPPFPPRVQRGVSPITCGPSGAGVGMGRLLRPEPSTGGEAPGFVDCHVVRVQPLHGGGAWGRRDVGPSGAGAGGAVTGGWWQPQWGPIGYIE